MKTRRLSVYFSVILSFFVIIVFCPKTSAQEYTDIDNDTTWKKSDNLTFNGPVYVNPGATLTIEKGADIKLEQDSEGNAGYLSVWGGRVIANGTVDEPIKITSLASQNPYYTVEFEGDNIWEGMAKPEPSFFRFVEFSGGGYKMESGCPGCEVFRFIPETFAFDDGGPAFYFGSGRAHLENCLFHDNKYADIGLERWMNVDNKNSYIHVINSNFDDGATIAVKSDIHCEVPSYDCRQNVLLKDNWYDNSSGPSGTDMPGEGKKISGTFTLDGWRKNDLIVDPVIIIPGITGSMPSKVVAGKLTLDPVLHLYDNLIASLEKNGYVKDKNIFDFPYEWRNSNVFSAEDLAERISKIRSETKISKVDVVAHSMGGLLTRQYIEGAEYGDDIDQLITLGTPHKGAPKSYMNWEAGETGIKFEDNISNKIFSLEAHSLGYDSLKDYIQSRVVSVRELLPDYDYLEKNGNMKNYPDDYPKNLFLEMLNKESALENLKKVDFTNIIGEVGSEKTIDKFRVVNSTVSGSWEHGMPENFYDLGTDRGIEYGKGDETVPIKSAEGIPADKKIVIDSIHSDLPTKAQCYVFKELSGKDDCEYVSTFSRVKNILTFGVFSPIDIQVMAPDGKRVGKNFTSGGEFDEIPGAYYSGSDTENEFLTIPDPIDGEYKILTQGTGEGEYKIEASKISEDENNSEKAIESTTKITGTAETGAQEELKLKVAGTEVTAGDQDKTPPVVEIASPENKTYQNNQMVEIKHSATDDRSAADKISKEASYDGQAVSKNNIDLSLEHLGAHNIYIQATDEAGNIGENKVEFTSVASVDSIIFNVNHYFSLKLITNTGTRNYLLAKLSIIKGEMRVVEEFNKIKLPKAAKDKLLSGFKKIINIELNQLVNQIQKDRNLSKTIDSKTRGLLAESLESIKP